MKWLLFLGISLMLTVGAVVLWQKTPVTAQSQAPQIIEQDAQLFGGAFELVDADGKTRTDQDFQGQFMLVYFGFTYCPDICPIGLIRITRVLQQLGDSADEVTPLFITVDPERDTPEQLKTYMTSFDERIVALTGSAEQIKQAANAYKVYYVKREEDSAMEYLVDHSAFTYLMDREGQLVHHFPHEATDDDIAKAIKRVLAAEFKAGAQPSPGAGNPEQLTETGE